MRALLGRVVLVAGFSLSSLKIYHATPFWPAEFLLKNQLITLWGFPCIYCFSLAAFNIFSLYFIFVSLINMGLGVFLLGFILYGTLHFLDLGDYFLSHVREVFNYNFFNYFLRPFLFLFFFWDPYKSNVVHLVLSQRSQKLSSFFFILYSVPWQRFPPFCLLGHLSILLPQLFCC